MLRCEQPELERCRWNNYWMLLLQRNELILRTRRHGQKATMRNAGERTWERREVVGHLSFFDEWSYDARE